MCRAYHPNDQRQLIVGAFLYALAMAFFAVLAVMATDGCTPRAQHGGDANTSTAEGIAKIEAEAGAAWWDLDQALHEGAKAWRAFVRSAQERIKEIEAETSQVRSSNAGQAKVVRDLESQLTQRDGTIRSLEQQLINKTHDQVADMAAFKAKYRVLGVQATIWWHWFLVACGALVVSIIGLLIFSNVTGAGWMGTAAKAVVSFVWNRLLRRG